jgi:hypothetical protein
MRVAMSVNGIAGALGGSGGATGRGHVAPPTSPPPGGGAISPPRSGGTGTTSGPRQTGSPNPGSGGGVTFGTYIPFTNFGSGSWIYSPPSANNSGFGGASAAFPTTGFYVSPTGGSSNALQLRLDQLRVAFLTAYVDFVRQRTVQQTFDVLLPTGFTPKKKAPTIAIQVPPPSISLIQQAYLPPSQVGASILSIIA